ncbi:MAG: integrase core domain-containing protein [Candidatus Doudnabacteria bacterium]
MPKDIKEERLRWVLPIANKQIKLTDSAKICEYGKRTLERWVAEYRKHGEAGLEPKSTRPKTNPNETPIRIKERIIELRINKKQCAKKIGWDLEEENIEIHYNTIGKIIRVEGLTRKYRTRKIKYNYVRIPLKKGELIEIDVKFVPGRIAGRRYYQFTAIDCASRWRYMQVYDNIDTVSAIAFLKELMVVVDFKIMAVKTDNAAIFTNRYNGYYKSDLPFPRPHAFDIACQKFEIPHYLIDPGKPQQNAFVERSHRTDQQKFYDDMSFASFEELKYKLRLWNMYYNDTKHCGLNGKTPNQMLKILT